MAREKDIKKPAPAPAGEAQPVQPLPKYDEGMVNLRSKSGAVLIDPYTQIRFDGIPQRVIVTSWVQCQLDAGKLEVAEG